MKLFTFIAFFALFLTACASREQVSNLQESQQKEDHFSFLENHASRLR